MSSTQSSFSGRKRKLKSLEMSSWSPTYELSTKSTDTYDRSYSQHPPDNSIFDDVYEYFDGETLPDPTNLGEIIQTLQDYGQIPRRY
ncbi:hypothetical protein TruAng_011742 [Truncatella angustata]|nr:hypothetical protein TruAng_011742 [Truncatella angustata]